LRKAGTSDGPDSRLCISRFTGNMVESAEPRVRIIGGARRWPYFCSIGLSGSLDIATTSALGLMGGITAILWGLDAIEDRLDTVEGRVGTPEERLDNLTEAP
jgi:hypothetical protein